MRSGWRRIGARHHCAILYSGGRPRRARIDIGVAQRAVLRRSEANGVRHLRAPQCRGRETRPAGLNGIAVYERAARSRGDGIHVTRVHKIDVANVRVVENVYVSNECVMDVDYVDEVAAAGEEGEKGFAKSQREPPHTKAKAEPKIETSAEEAYKSRAENRRTKERSRAPTPSAANERPAAIVEGSKAPRIIVNPSPAPGIDPIPIAVAVRSPAWRNIRRIPDVTILRFVAPSAVIIEVVIAGHVARNVPPGGRTVFFEVALFRPTIQSIRGRCARNAVGRIVRAIKLRLFARTHFVRLPVGGNFTFAAKSGNAGGVTGFVHVNAERAGLLDIEDHVRRIDLVQIALPQLANAEIQAAFGKPYLGDALVEVQKGKCGHAAKMESRLPRLQFGAGIFVHPNLVSNGHGAIFGGIAPVALAARLQGNGTVYVANASDTRRRIFVLIGSRLRRHKQKKA